ncbi:MAG: hypothetical protein ACREKE_04645 [bacterium]
MSKEHGFPWITVAIALALVAFYTVWLTHSFPWHSTPWDGVVGIVSVGLVPVATCFVLSRIVSWILRKPYFVWTTENQR